MVHTGFYGAWTSKGLDSQILKHLQVGLVPSVHSLTLVVAQGCELLRHTALHCLPSKQMAPPTALE